MKHLKERYDVASRPGTQHASTTASCRRSVPSMSTRDLTHLKSLILDPSSDDDDTIAIIGGGEREDEETTAVTVNGRIGSSSDFLHQKARPTMTTTTMQDPKPSLAHDSIRAKTQSSHMAFITALVLGSDGGQDNGSYEYDDATVVLDAECQVIDQNGYNANLGQWKYQERNTDNDDSSPSVTLRMIMDHDKHDEEETASQSSRMVTESFDHNSSTPTTTPTNTGTTAIELAAAGVTTMGAIVEDQEDDEETPPPTEEFLPYAVVESADVIVQDNQVEGFALTDEGSSQCTCKKNRLVKLAFVIGGIALACGLLVSSFNKSSSDDNGGLAPTREWESSARLAEMRVVFEEVSSPMDFLNPLSPQSQALDWLVYKDTLLTSINDPNLFQRYLLLVMAFGNNGGGWRGIAPWDQFYGDHECDVFAGIDCNEDNEVVHLDMHNRRMTGSIPNELGILTSLTKLQFGNNDLVGTIPTSLYQLTNLVSLDISMNEISSTISPDVGKLSKLEYFLFSRTLLTGSLPDTMKQLTAMKWFIVSHSAQSGDAIDMLMNWSDLELVDIGFSNMQGTITSELAKLTNLKYFVAPGRDIEGTMFTELGTMTNLLEIFLPYNMKGPIPSEIGNLTNMQHLQLSSPGITGTIPKEIGNLANSLSSLGCITCGIDGAIPTELGLLTKLTSLVLTETNLNGTVPTEIGLLTNLRVLQLEKNQLTGTLPTELENLPNLLEIFY